MSSTRYILVALAVAGSVGCGGARIAELESELSTAKETNMQLATENASLKEANAAMQPKADELAKIAESRKQLHDDLQAALLPMIDAGKLSLGIRKGAVTT